MAHSKNAVPLCIPNNCIDPNTGEYRKGAPGERGYLCVMPEALQQLREVRYPVSVVAIAGPARKGKSYFISKAFEQGEVFSLGASLKPETLGIWRWIVHKTYKDKNGMEFKVVLLDSKGIGATCATNTDDNQIFTLTVLLSSILIYNSAGCPTRDDLDKLAYPYELSKLAFI